jgi:hypothetical protein
MLPVIGRLLAKGYGNGHLRHYRRPATPDQAAVDQDDRCSLTRRFQRRINAGGSSANYEYVTFKLHR